MIDKTLHTVLSLPHDPDDALDLAVLDRLEAAVAASGAPGDLEMLAGMIWRVRSVGLHYARDAEPGDTLGGFIRGEVTAKDPAGNLTVGCADGATELSGDVAVLVAARRAPEPKPRIVSPAARAVLAAQPVEGPGTVRIERLTSHNLHAIRLAVDLVGGTATIAPDVAADINAFLGDAALVTPVSSERIEQIGGLVELTRTTARFPVAEPHAYVLALRTALYTAYGSGRHPTHSIHLVVRRVEKAVAA